MKKFLLVLLVVFPLSATSQGAQAAVVYNWEDSMSCFSVTSCSTTGVNDYSAAVQGYSGLTNGTSTFNGTFIRSGNSVLVTLSGLPTHDRVDIDFLLAIIDSWDGSSAPNNTAPDFFNVAVDGTSIYRESYTNFPSFRSQSATTSNRLSLAALGFSQWNDSAYDMGALSAFTGIAHSSSVLQVEFFANGTGWQSTASNTIDESFGLEDIAINVYNSSPGTTVDEPLGFGILGLGLAGLVLARRKRKQTGLY